MRVKLILVDLIPARCDAFREQFDDLPNAEVVNGYFESLLEYDCMVSAQITRNTKADVM